MKVVRAKFGVGAVDEPGYEIKAFGAKNVLMIAAKATNLVLTHGGGEKIPAPCRPLIATPGYSWTSLIYRVSIDLVTCPGAGRRVERPYQSCS
ncbi:MAG: hypothetical protein DRN47_04990 [Candidatus Wolframiiraptor sp.]|nr:MAG: hypothetical protein DRN47_04990 [Candidatus Wolframiiraptor sp.]